MNKMIGAPADEPVGGNRPSAVFGTTLLPDGTRFRLWAPRCHAVGLQIMGPEQSIIKMDKGEGGWHVLHVEGVGAGTLYQFMLPNGQIVPDPASRHQPRDVDGPSEVIDPGAYQWAVKSWKGRPWEEAVLYELHIGTFTSAGTFLAAIENLDHLQALGITAIELMPLADFKGRWNWGYDGAFLFAPDASYGRPEDLMAFIDAAHARSMMVFLDVVYNHFGPVGNHLANYAPVLTDKYTTPWGEAVNFDDTGSEVVRELFIANALQWLGDYRFDGLRFDAVHEIHDESEPHFLKELAERIRSSIPDRHVHLVAENSNNEAGWLRRRKKVEVGLYTAQWSDDIHHALHCAVTGENHWYYADYHGRPDLLARSLAEGLSYQGERMVHDDRRKGEPSAFLPPTAFVSYIQNHDQTGNRPFGDRITTLASRQAVRTLAAINLLSPHIPLIFMGEEWGTTRPFMFFSDIGEDLADSIRESRRKEFENSPDAADTARSLPDPMAQQSFLDSKLDWSELDEGDHLQWLDLYRRLIELRIGRIVPLLQGINGFAGTGTVIADRAYQVTWKLAHGSVLTLLANLSAEPLDDVQVWDTNHLWLEGTASTSSLGPWSAVWNLTPPTD